MFSTSQLIELLLDRYGLSAYRTTIGTDMELLKSFGLDIVTVKSSQNKYYINSRRFSLPEIKLLIDAVYASRFIPKDLSDDLAKKLAGMTSVWQGASLKRNLYSEGKLKKHSDELFETIEIINEAINLKKKISFQYFYFDVKKECKLKNSGIAYKFSPYAMVWNGEFYYMVGFSDKHGGIGSFRVDRIYKSPIITSEDSIETDDFNIDEYTDGMFRMFNSERKDIELICDNSVMDAILDKFGMNVNTFAYDMKSFRVEANIAVNHVFYSWIFGFGGKVRIKSPEEIKKHYEEMLHEAIENT